MASKNLQNSKLADEQDINILLLGETGVGKSTFINSVANYFNFKNIKEACKSELLILVPGMVTINDKNSKPILIKIGSDNNEYQDVGASGTQNVKTYVFPINKGKTRLRLIDSPGMGDPRGIEQDDLNCEHILAYLSQLKELHAICFIMRPTTTRITAFFQYCVDQILSRLEKSASKNIIFIFTNTRGTNYTPGDTLPCLRKVVDEIKAKPPHVDIPLQNNIFSLDNEAFKYLVGLKRGYKFDRRTQQAYMASWNASSKECWRMVSYIIGDEKSGPLPPHQLQNTLSINEARRLVIYLSKPLADISQLIFDNITVLERHQQSLNLENQTLEQLKGKMYIPTIVLDVKELTQPVTVCTNTKCAELVQVGEVSKWHYGQRCHDPCHLSNVPKEIVGDSALQNCYAMADGRSCRECGCDYTVHMHIYYMTTTVEDRIVDKVVVKNIREKEAAVAAAQTLVEDMAQRKKELEEERDVIINSTAKFAHFLQHNAICPFSDSYKAYIEYLIRTEKGRGRYSDQKTIQNLEQLLRQYMEIKAAFDNSLKLVTQYGLTTPVSSVTPQNILQTVRDLYQLKHNGKKIYELSQKQKTSRDAEYDLNCEYVHPKITEGYNSESEEYEDAVMDSEDENSNVQVDKPKEDTEKAGESEKGEKEKGADDMMEMMKMLMRSNQEVLKELQATREENASLKKELEELREQKGSEHSEEEETTSK